MKHFKTKHETTNASLPSVLTICGEGIDGGKCYMNSSLLSLETFQEHGTNECHVDITQIYSV